MFTNNFSKDSKITIILMAAATAFLCELISYIYQIIIFNLSIEVFAFLKIILIEILFNSMIIIIIYPIIQKSGILLERIFTEDRVLTRYY